MRLSRSEGDHREEITGGKLLGADHRGKLPGGITGEEFT